MDKRELSLLDLLNKKPTLKDLAQRQLLEMKQISTLADQMLLESLVINNLWCYREAQLEFEEGITVIAGPNGSGKSSLLESIFFALYGSRAAPAMERSLAEILREGARSGQVKLEFAYGGHSYTAQMALKRQRDSVISERETCKLKREDGIEWIGVENVAATVQELFNMDRDDFTNCIYVRQGEIDRLIRTSEEERRQMIDRLLRLDKLDNYVIRAKEGARRAVNRKADILQSKLNDLEIEIEKLKAEELQQKKTALKGAIEQKQREIKNFEEQIVRKEELLANLREQLKRFAEITKEIEGASRDLSEKEKKLKQRAEQEMLEQQTLKVLGQKREKLETQLQENLTKLGLEPQMVLRSLESAQSFANIALIPNELAANKAKLEEHKSMLQEHKEQLATLRAQMDQLAKLKENQKTQLMDLKREVEQELAVVEKEQAEGTALLRSIAQSREEGLKEIDKLRDLDCGLKIPSFERVEDLDLTALRADFIKQLEKLQDEREELSRKVIERHTRKEEAEKELANTEELIKLGRCPTCKQSVTAATFTEAIAHLKTHIQDLEEVILEDEKSLAKLNSQIGTFESAGDILDSLVSIITKLKPQIEHLLTKQENIEKVSTQLKSIEERMKKLEQEREESEQKILELKDQIRSLDEGTAQLSAELKLIEARLVIIEGSEELCYNLLRTRDQLLEKQAAYRSLKNTIEDLHGDIAALKHKIEELKSKVGDQAELEKEEDLVLKQLQDLKSARAKFIQERESLIEKSGIINSQLQRLEQLLTEKERLAQEHQKIERTKNELEEISNLYESVKKELRKRNIQALNLYFNEFFHLMDAGDSYNRVIITDDYEIEVALKNGERISPTIMSGGERALINIALRCAIHQVLAKAVRKMPLILDEPTVYLDRDRIHRLQFLLEDLGKRVGQVIVVSHEVGLVESADHEYRTEKGSDNISTVRRVK